MVCGGLGARWRALNPNAGPFLVQDSYLGTGQPPLRSMNVQGSTVGVASGPSQQQQQHLRSLYGEQQQQCGGAGSAAQQGIWVKPDPDLDDNMDDMLNMFLKDS